MANIVFVHLLNDRSGSPRVLAQVIEALSQTHDCTLYVGDSSGGILSDLFVRKRTFPYRRSNNKLLTLLSYVWSQIRLFFRMLSDPRFRSADMIYINTLLPFGAALAGQVLGRRVVYHLHEVSLSPPLLMWFLKAVARLCSVRAFYVSEAHRALLPMNGLSTRVIPNAYDKRFVPAATPFSYSPKPTGHFVCLMIASLRDYKGVPVLMSLARHFATNSAFKFVLVANDSDERVAEFRLAHGLANVEIIESTDSPEVYYQSASILLNLSNPDEWIETFGLTLIEAMAFGVPVIAPPIGGPTEIVRHGVDGYLIDSRNFGQLTAVLTQLSHDDERLFELSAAARERAGSFSPARYQERVLSEIEGVLGDV